MSALNANPIVGTAFRRKKFSRERDGAVRGLACVRPATQIKLLSAPIDADFAPFKTFLCDRSHFYRPASPVVSDRRLQCSGTLPKIKKEIEQ
jgi:hypothetical protein